jgi:hypothetical protein
LPPYCSARAVTAIDIDETSVATTRAALTKFAPNKNWKAEFRSVFDIGPDDGQFDIVYSWGVLHHTGDIWQAITHSTQLVAPGGMLAIAIYTTTAMDGSWKVEKRAYSRAPRLLQWLIRQAYVGAYLGAQPLLGKIPFLLCAATSREGWTFFTTPMIGSGAIPTTPLRPRKSEASWHLSSPNVAPFSPSQSWGTVRIRVQ